ncbi:hypothetical protein PMAYCL1PPCAC_05217 [Pristionchus mayeri]|uniref:Uncharacterized protein n=1 Tax=Pristionchus mayeri TaxID=1317129 RepID=A0AAN4ZC21_9BILA|nr:hypothetical protein PMAYCL1PPCAC_05217 [Pristionchus mayeri]
MRIQSSDFENECMLKSNPRGFRQWIIPSVAGSILVLMALCIFYLELQLEIERKSAREEIRFVKQRPEAAHVDCARLYLNDTEYMKELAKTRPALPSVSTIVLSCETIRNRFFPARNPDINFPVLHARIVFQDYEFLEEQLATNYASENVYCFSIDFKAPSIFHEQIHNLERCLPNVFVSRDDLEFDSAGHNQNEAHLNCMKTVLHRNWEYAILMQNHDVIIKTHGEITEILKIYGGANEIDVGQCPDHRCIESLEMNLGKLKLCPKSLNATETKKCESSNITWGKGAMQGMLSRAAVDYIFDEIDVVPLMKQMNDMGYGVDEQLYGSLQVTTEIRFPGAFHVKCRDNDSQSITRLTNTRPAFYGMKKRLRSVVNWITNSPDNDCPSGRQRHASCIFGIEDLPTLAAAKQVMANKILPNFDIAVTSCLSELLFNRTRDGPNIDRRFYENINKVRYHRDSSKPGFNIDEFKCEL